MSQVNRLYQCKMGKKFSLFFATFFAVLLLMFVVVIMSPVKLPIFAIALGAGITTIWSSCPKIFVDQDKIHFKIMLNKINCPFDQG